MAKKKVICDTDVMIDYWDLTHPRHAATKSLLENNIGLDQIVLSAITKMELLMGVSNKRDLIEVSKKIARYNIALINGDITLKSFELLRNYRLSNGLALPDSIIAATAIVSQLELFTYNTKDYKFISHIKFFKP